MKRLMILLLLAGLAARAQTQMLDTASAVQRTDHDSAVIKKKHAWLKPAIALGYTGATYLCYRVFDKQIQDESQEGKTTLTKAVSTSISNLGLGKTQAIGWAGTAVLSLALKDKKLQKTVIVWAGGLLMNSVATEQLKLTFQRHRPNTGDPYNTFDWRGGPKINKSFPSAHTSNIFTTATVFATLYKDHTWVPPVAYGLATLVGFSRVYNNAHWASDVLTGAAVGFLSAKASIAIYNKLGKKLLFLPQPGMAYSSVAIVYRF